MRRIGIAAASCVAVLIALCFWSLRTGASPVGTADMLAALFSGDDTSRDVLVVRMVRLPRVIAALAAGSALAVAGAIMQAVTNNPLASPGLLGINAGASFAVVLALVLLEPMGGHAYAWLAFAGAAIAGIGVYMLGSAGGGATPLKLALAGVIFASFLGSVTSALLLADKATLDVVRFWTVGSLSGRQLETVLPLSLYVLAGLGAAITLARQVTLLSLGWETASALGQSPFIWRGTCLALVVVLAGSAVAIAGPIGFVGLVVPHIARMLFGGDYRLVIVFSAFAGAALLLVADTAFRHLLPGSDIPAGVTMALIGAPFFVYLARRRLEVSAWQGR